MKRESFENHRLRTILWIVSTLDRHHRLSLKEINELWVADESISGGLTIDRRTFYNYLMAIGDLLRVVIECDRKDGNRYFIAAREDSKMTEWLMRSFATNEVLAVYASNLHDRVLLEDIPSGEEHLRPIMEAMRTNRKITFVYQEFHDSVPHEVREVAPYCVKIFHQRWYVLVKEWRTLLVSYEKVEEMLIYSLDRIQSLQVTQEAFELDPLFDAKEFFRYAFGVRVEKNNPPCTVRLKVAAAQRKYFRTLPLHHSQQEVETERDYSIFELHVALTVELLMQILYNGSLVEVLEPQDLRDAVAEQAFRMADIYSVE